MYTPVAGGSKAASCAAHAVVLQLPLEGVLSGGGLAAVLKRPAGRHPEWLVGPHNRDFFISFAEVNCWGSWCQCLAPSLDGLCRELHAAGQSSTALEYLMAFVIAIDMTMQRRTHVAS